jgi:hypothetical protein
MLGQLGLFRRSGRLQNGSPNRPSVEECLRRIGMPNPEAPKSEVSSLLFRNSQPDVAVAGLGPGVLEQFNVNDCTLYASALGALGLQGLQGTVNIPSSHAPIITPRPDAIGPDFGVDFKTAPPDPANIAQQVRGALRGLVPPGIDPDDFLNVHVDVADGQLVANGSFTLPSTRGTWARPSPRETVADFTTEYMGTWPERAAWFNFEGRQDDYVNAMYAAVGIDMAGGPDQTIVTQTERERGYQHAHDFRFFEASWVSNPVGSDALPRGRQVEVPLFELASNPTINLDEVRHRRFDLIDRATALNIEHAGALGRAAGRRLAAMRTPHPFIAAVLKKRFPERRYLCSCPFPAPIEPPEGGTICGLCSLACGTNEEAPREQKLTVWEMLRANYALFE